MKKFDDIKNREEIYNNYSEESKELIKCYSETLGITEQEAHDIIISNVTALMYLYFNSTIILKNFNDSLHLLIKCTIFRQEKEFGKITDNEKKLVKKYYEIDII